MQEEWKEKDFQQRLVDLLYILGAEFYRNILDNSKDRDLPIVLEQERFITIQKEYPQDIEVSSRPDIFIETNRNNAFGWELKISSSYDENQLIRHEDNLKKWCEKNGKNYLGLILVLNVDSEKHKISFNFNNRNIAWVGWDIIYRSIEDYRVNTLGKDLKIEIDDFFNKLPVSSLKIELLNNLIYKTSESDLYLYLKKAIMSTDLMEKIKTQMEIDQFINKYNPIIGNEKSDEYSEKAETLFLKIFNDLTYKYSDHKYIKKPNSNELENTIWIEFIDESGDYMGYLTFYFGLLLKNKNEIILKAQFKSGKKKSIVNALVILYKKDKAKFDTLFDDLKHQNIEIYLESGFGTRTKVDGTSENIDEIENSTFVPLYLSTICLVWNRTRDDIVQNLILIIDSIIKTYSILLENI